MTAWPPATEKLEVSKGWSTAMVHVDPHAIVQRPEADDAAVPVASTRAPREGATARADRETSSDPGLG
eukprot:4894310-Prymnesium_polylepis.1